MEDYDSAIVVSGYVEGLIALIALKRWVCMWKRDRRGSACARGRGSRSGAAPAGGNTAALFILVCACSQGINAPPNSSGPTSKPRERAHAHHGSAEAEAEAKIVQLPRSTKPACRIPAGGEVILLEFPPGDDLAERVHQQFRDEILRSSLTISDYAELTHWADDLANDESCLREAHNIILGRDFGDGDCVARVGRQHGARWVVVGSLGGATPRRVLKVQLVESTSPPDQRTFEAPIGGPEDVVEVVRSAWQELSRW